MQLSNQASTNTCGGSTSPSLETLPQPAINRILTYLAPNYHLLSQISKRFYNLINTHVSQSVKKYKDDLDESEVWGHPPPMTLGDLMTSDPMLVSEILNDVYHPRIRSALAAVNNAANAATAATGGMSVANFGSAFHTGAHTISGTFQAGSVGAKALAAAAKAQNQLNKLQGQFMRAFRVALDCYAEGGWANVRLLKNFMRSHRLQYLLLSSSPLATASPLNILATNKPATLNAEAANGSTDVDDSSSVDMGVDVGSGGKMRDGSSKIKFTAEKDGEYHDDGLVDVAGVKMKKASLEGYRDPKVAIGMNLKSSCAAGLGGGSSGISGHSSAPVAVIPVNNSSVASTMITGNVFISLNTSIYPFNEQVHLITIFSSYDL
jgi:hypothetical protein